MFERSVPDRFCTKEALWHLSPWEIPCCEHTTIPNEFRHVLRPPCGRSRHRPPIDDTGGESLVGPKRDRIGCRTPKASHWPSPGCTPSPTKLRSCGCLHLDLWHFVVASKDPGCRDCRGELASACEHPTVQLLTLVAALEQPTIRVQRLEIGIALEQPRMEVPQVQGVAAREQPTVDVQRLRVVVLDRRCATDLSGHRPQTADHECATVSKVVDLPPIDDQRLRVPSPLERPTIQAQRPHVVTATGQRTMETRGRRPRATNHRCAMALSRCRPRETDHRHATS